MSSQFFGFGVIFQRMNKVQVFTYIIFQKISSFVEVKNFTGHINFVLSYKPDRSWNYQIFYIFRSQFNIEVYIGLYFSIDFTFYLFINSNIMFDYFIGIINKLMV